MTANEMMAQAKDLPPVSPAALKLVSLLDQPTISNEDVVTVLKHDSVLTAKLLRACNSPVFGFEEPIASVDQAVLLMGHQQILQVVLSLTFGSAMSVAMPGYAVNAEELWRHALTTATAAEIIVSRGVNVDAEPAVAFTAGLLHDIGKLVLAQLLTEESQAAIRALVEQKQFSRAEAEKEILGADHCEAGACLLQSWRVPEEIVEAVANHHQPPLKPRPRLSAVTHVANCIAHLAGSAPGWEAYAVRTNDGVAEALDISADNVENLVMNVRESFERVDQFMSIA
jgi:putative nucleotidyltransferase with HDIG domain